MQGKQVKQQTKNEITLSIENTHEESKKELINMTPSVLNYSKLDDVGQLLVL